MSHYLELANWNRRDVFEFFRNFDKPYFNLCTNLDITELRRALRSSGLSISLANHYFALRVANDLEPFRYRLRSGRVFVHDVIHGGTTVLMKDGKFTLAYFDYQEDFGGFMDHASRAVDEVLAGDGAFTPLPDDGRIHFTTIPWVSFTSFSHARNWGREDSVPKIAFGKFVDEKERTLLPISVEVHHALVDGLHVGQYLEQLQIALTNAKQFISSAKI